jgi:hypothetical protein
VHIVARQIRQEGAFPWQEDCAELHADGTEGGGGIICKLELEVLFTNLHPNSGSLAKVTVMEVDKKASQTSPQ